MLDLLRTIRNALYDLSSIQVYGVGIDIVLHLVVAFALVVALRRFIGVRKSVYVTAALILLKELVDIFAKSSVEYIRPPSIDFVLDVGFGAAGIGLALWIPGRQSGAGDCTADKIHNPGTAEAGGEALARVCGIVLGILCLALLLQGIYVSVSKPGLIIVSALCLLCYLGSKGRPDPLLFLLVGMGPLVNAPGFVSAPYLYNIEAALLCYFAVWLIANNRRVRLDSTPLKLYALFFLTLLPGVFSQWLAGNGVAELRLVRGFFLGLCLALFLASIRPTLARHVTLLLRSMIVTGFCVVLWGLLELLLASTDSWQFRHEPRALFSGSATLAIYLLAVIPVAVMNRATLGGRGFGLLALSVVLGGFLLLLATRSRIGLIALLLSGGLYLLFALSKHRVGKASLVAGTLGFTLAALAALAMVVYKTLASSAMDLQGMPASMQDFAQLLGTLLASRLTPWGHGLEHVANSPLVGNGAIDNVYNVYLQLAAAFGIPALIGFGLLVCYCLWPRRRFNTASEAGQNEAHGLVWSMVALLLVGLAESTLGNQLAYLVWTVFLLVACRHGIGRSPGSPLQQPGASGAPDPDTIPVGHVVPDWNR